MATLRARAAQELLNRRKAARQTEFIPYLQAHGLDTPAHVRLIGDLIERVHRREGVRAIISMPPRHGKTESILQGFAWLLKMDPTQTHAYATYAGSLSASKSRRVRRYAAEAKVSLDRTSSATSEWRTVEGGGLLAVGVGGPLTGQGVTGLGVVDDPIKNRQEAESPTIRDRVWDWFLDVFYTRLEPGSSAIVIATRWHTDDLIGRLINMDMGWEVISFPAIAEEHDDLGRRPGEALWPARYDTRSLASIRSQLGEFSWASLYQQQPRPRGGALFRGEPARHDGNTVGKRITVTVDLAASEKRTADYTVLTAAAHWGSTEEDRGVDILEVARGQWDIARIHQVLADWQARYGVVLDVEQVAAQVQVVGHIKQRQTYVIDGRAVTLPAIRVRTFSPQGDKFARALPAIAAWGAGRIRVPSAPAAWLPDWLTEHANFTGTGKDEHDDQVDCTSRTWQLGARPHAQRVAPSAGPTRARTHPIRR